MIKLVNVSKKYGDFYAVKNINVEIGDGEFIGIIGGNGAGKSTFIRLINGLVEATEGEIFVDNFKIGKDDIYEIRKRVGMLFQNPDNQIVATTVVDEIAFGLENLMYPPEEIEKRIDEALRLVNMESYRDMLTTNLSGGQKQRIAFASIIAMNSSHLLLDEPTSLIDVNGRKKIMNIVKKLHRHGKTILLISHYLEEIFLADRIMVFKNGEIIFFDTPKMLLRNDEILKIIDFPLPLHLRIAKEVGITPASFDMDSILVELRKKL